jgi:type III pantothenate kinase
MENTEMLLGIDIGNSNIVLGLFEKNELIAEWRLTTHLNRTVDEHAMLILDLFGSRGISASQVQAIICSNVVPPLMPIFIEFSQKYFGIDPLLVNVHMNTGLIFTYDDPQEIGADRIVNAVAGFEIYRRPLIIVDFGTATTFCAISGKGEYLGGLIAPGILISTEALVAKTAKLPKVELVRPKRVIGKNTVSSMQAGTVIGFACLVDGLIMKMKEEMGGHPFVLATGGMAPIISPESKLIQEIRPHLTLEGLRILFEKNRPKTSSLFSA